MAELVEAYEADNLQKHVELEKKSENGVEEMARLVDQIKEWQQRRKDQHILVTQNAFTIEDDRVKAQAYLRQIDEWISKLWLRIADATTEVPTLFTDILKWQHEQIPLLDRAMAEWKYERRICLMGGPADNLNTSFGNLKIWFEILESMSICLRNHIDRYLLVLDELSNTYRQCEQFLLKCRQLAEDCEKKKYEIKCYNANLVQKGMMVYEEPPSVIRRSGNPNANRSQKHSKIPFNMEIRFLSGEKSGLLRENLEMEALLISEQLARDIVEGRANPVNEKLLSVGNIAYPICTLQAPSPVNDGYMSAKFAGARLQKVEKAAEDDASRVMYHILFRTKMKRTANGAITYYPFWAISLPFSVVINANRQERYKRALMFWQLAFATDDKTSLPLQFDEKNEKTSRIRWSDFFNALNLWFKNGPLENDKQAQKLQRGLEEHEGYLQDKIGLKQTADYMGNVITWDMFYRRKSELTGLTFWEWIFAVVESISKFPYYWESGLVLGFASRGRVEQMLSAATESSMVMKFSDSRAGKMVASYVNWNAQGMKIIEHVIFDETDDPVFAGKTLIECIRMSTKLHCVKTILPSSKPIDELYNLENTVGSRSMSQKNRSDGYVKPGVVFVWGEPPIPPIYQSEIRSTASVDSTYNDSSLDSPTASNSTQMNFDNIPEFRNWLNTPYIDSQPQNMQTHHLNYNTDSSGSVSNQYGVPVTTAPVNFQQAQQPQQPRQQQIQQVQQTQQPQQVQQIQQQNYSTPIDQQMADLMSDTSFTDDQFNISHYLTFNN